VSGPTNGTIVINTDGTYTYTPNAGFSGTDVVVVSICDAGLPLPGICVNDTIFITVNAVNDAPIVDNEFVTTTEETPATGDLTDAGDSDPDGTALTANTTPVSGPSNGTIVINADGTYTYTPNTNFNGVDTVVVSVCDAGTPGVICVNDTIFITVTAVNDAPIVDNEIITTNEDTPVTGDLTDAGDTDPDGTSLTVDITPVSGPSNGTIVINADGTFTYTPNPGFTGTDTIVVSICDEGLPLPGICVNDTIFITVVPCSSNPAFDCDGDGVTNGQEVADGTNPTDPCSLLIASQTEIPSTVWNDADCDNDGLTNGEEMVGTTDPLNPDTDGDGVLDGTEVADGTNPTDPCSLLIASQTVTSSSAWNESDCDNDGVTNGLEVANSSDPFNPCSPKPCDILIPEAFTPDGDGINDEFVIEGIELYPNNTIAIFNRWGVLVYEASNYENNWDGSTQSNFTLGGDDLPTATYYYVFDTKDENVGVFTGYIYLQR
jgi:gliding motility-associated-like protein